MVKPKMTIPMTQKEEILHIVSEVGSTEPPILSKVVQGERRTKRKARGFYFFMPSRRLRAAAYLGEAE